MKQSKTIQITSSKDIVAFAKDIRTGKRRVAQNFNVNLNKMPKNESIHLSKKINDNYFACGCKEGTITGLVALVLGLFWILNKTNGYEQWRYKHIFYVVGIMVIGMGLGKLYGKAMAKMRLKHTVNTLFEYDPEAREIGKGDGSGLCGVGQN